MEVKTNSPQAWVLSIRPKTLSGALIPVLLAGALAWHDASFSSELWVWCALFACLMQIAANMINDLYDYLKGTDREDRLGPERACAQGWITPAAMRWGIGVVIGLACGCGLVALVLGGPELPHGGWELVAMGVGSVLFAFLYTTCLSYLGLGDVLVLAFFGFVPVCGTYYLMVHCITQPAVLLSLISGVSIDALLVINNYRDREQDRISGKRTLVVLMGEAFGRWLYLGLGVVTVVLSLGLLAMMGRMDVLHLLPLVLYLLLHYATWRKMCQIGQGRALNRILGQTSRNMFVLAVLLALAIVL